MYEYDLERSFPRFQIGEEWSEIGVPKVLSFMIRQKDGTNRPQPAACVFDLFDTDKDSTESGKYMRRKVDARIER